MTDCLTLASAGDTILSTVLSVGVPVLRASLHRQELEEFKGRGTTFLSVDEADDEEEHMMVGTTPDDRTRVQVDVKRVLEEVVRPLGMGVGTPAADAFLRMTSDKLPGTCGLYFLMDQAVPPFAVRAIDPSPVSVVVHANPNLSLDYNDTGHRLGVHVLRLRDLPAVDWSEVAEILHNILELRSAAQLPTVASEADVKITMRIWQSADPARVEEYARTADDRLFEAATAKILFPLVSGLLPLGANLTGLPVPDGFAFETSATVREVATYDCKSKVEDWYSVGPRDADQQVRYTAILDRLRSKGWSPFGILLFCPTFDVKEFESKAEKDYLKAIEAKGYRLRLVEARSLRRWHDLSLEEGARHETFFNRTRFWQAFTRFELPGVDDSQREGFVGDRSRALRAITLAHAELIWLAALEPRPPVARELAQALRATDPTRVDEEKIDRPSILTKFFEELRRPQPSLDSLRKATTLGADAVRYLLMAERFHPEGVREIGKWGVGNLDRLREEVGLTALGGK